MGGGDPAYRDRHAQSAPATGPGGLHVPVHDRTVVARMGLWLGSAFTICFLTGSAQPPAPAPGGLAADPDRAGLGLPGHPGVHVASGTASVPLLLAKLYAAYPRLFARPVVGSPAVMLERASIGVLVGSSLLMVSSGIANVAGWYVFGFGFTKVHYAFAWVAIGALVVHIAVKLPAIRDALSPAGTEVASQQGRRTFVAGAVGVAAGAVVLTVGSAVPLLEPVSVLRSRRPGSSPLGVPVNRTAAQAGSTRARPRSGDDDWELSVRGPAGVQR